MCKNLIIHFRPKVINFILASSLLLGGCYPCTLHAQENKSISISLIPKIGYTYSYYHLTSKSYRKNFRITTGLGGCKIFYWGLGLQLGLWNEWKATLTLSQTYIGGKQNYDFSRFSNLPKGQRFDENHRSFAFPTNFLTLNFAKKVWRFRMGAIKDISLASELDVLFGAGIMWIPKNSNVQKEQWVWGMTKENRWILDNLAGFVATPTNYTVGILNAGFTYRLFINHKARLVLGAQYSYGLQASYLIAYKSTYYYDNYITNVHEHSIEDFNAETGRHQFTIFIGYPIALYRNKAEKKYLKAMANP